MPSRSRCFARSRDQGLKSTTRRRLLDRPTQISNPLTSLGFLTISSSRLRPVSDNLARSFGPAYPPSAQGYASETCRRVPGSADRRRRGPESTPRGPAAPTEARRRPRSRTLATLDLLSCIVTRIFRSPDALAVDHARLLGKSRKSAQKPSKHVADAFEKPFVPPLAKVVTDRGNRGKTT